MFLTEDDYIQTLFFEDGQIKAELSSVISEIEYTGYQYDDRDGNIFLQNADQKEFTGVGDTRGNYAYIRYANNNGGHQYNDNNSIVRLKFVLCLPKCGTEAVKVGLKIINYLDESRVPGCKLNNFSVLNSNRVEIFTQETGVSKDRVNNDLSLVSFDFDMIFSSPNDCDFTDYSCTKCD